MKWWLAPLCAVLLAGCDGPNLTGNVTGVVDNPYAPVAPLGEPEDASFTFEPFLGVPGNVGDEMLTQLWRRVEDEGLTVVKRPGGRALFDVKGTLTAVSDDTNALIFYVFDVTDVSGRRLHRISGTKRSTSNSGDPWASVDSSDLDIIARRVAALLRAWIYSDA